MMGSLMSGGTRCNIYSKNRTPDAFRPPGTGVESKTALGTAAAELTIASSVCTRNVVLLLPVG